MAEPTPVNEQITDAVTQSNVKIIGEAPAIAMGNFEESEEQEKEDFTGENKDEQE